MEIRDVGDRMNLEHLVYDPFTDPPTLLNATVALSVTDPAGAVTTPSVSTPSTGTYRASFTLASAGVWYWRWAVTGTVIDISDGQVMAEALSPPSYATLDQLKALRSKSGTDRDDDLSQALATASRRIDRATGERQFWLDKTVSARIYRVVGRTYCDPSGEVLAVDDIGNTTGLVVETGDGTTFSAVTNYQTGPENALARRKPINRLIRPLSYWNSTHVRVTARWGWPSIPDEVVRATLIQANRLYLRKDSPEGVLGSAEWGVSRVAKVDPDVEAMIGDLTLMGVG